MDYALHVARLSTRINKKVEWLIGETELLVSKWASPTSGDYVLSIWAGWPTHLLGKSLKVLDPAGVFAYATAGLIYKLTPSQRAKSKIRLLQEAGFVPKPTLSLPQLPDEATDEERRAWDGIRTLLLVERACTCRPPGTPIVATPSFLGRWTGVSDEVADDAIARLRRRGLLNRVGQVPLRGTPYRANLYEVVGDGP